MAVSIADTRLARYLAFAIRAGLIGVGVACLAICVFVAWSGRLSTFSNVGVGLYFVTPLLASAVCAAAAFRLSNRRAFLLIREGGFLVVVILVTETFLTGFFPPAFSLLEERERAADRLERDFDSRSITQVVDDLGKERTTAYASFPVSWTRREEAKGHIPDSIYPLSNVSNATIVECNEGGDYMVYTSDEYGFQNPQGFHNSRSVDIAVVGSSFSLGRCVPIGAGMIDQVRARFPAILNLGMTGANNNTMLATFREYVEPLEPPVVLWEVYPGALLQTDGENDPVLVKYLNPGFAQNLRARRSEVDGILRNFVPDFQRNFDERLEEREKMRRARSLSWSSVAKLSQLRRRLLPGAAQTDRGAHADLTPFIETVRMVRESVEQWGGRFYVVYVPSYHELIEKDAQSGINLDRIVSLMERENIALIEGVSLFANHPDPVSLYALRINGHFTEEGHRLVGNLITERLQSDHGDVLRMNR